MWVELDKKNTRLEPIEFFEYSHHFLIDSQTYYILYFCKIQTFLKFFFVFFFFFFFFKSKLVITERRMNEVIVLEEGFSKVLDDSTMNANCSCTLIKTPEKNIIVDTMTAWDKDCIIRGKY